jgi:amino acid transporter
MVPSTPTAPPAGDTTQVRGKGLKPGALGLATSIVIGIASTAPAYSLAASIGLVSSEVGVKAPLIMLLAFVPILFISFAFRALNSRIPDCGTNFTWGARAFGPYVGWMSGWGAIMAQVIVLANLAQIAGIYTFKLFGADGAAGSVGWVAVAGSIWLLLMTYIAYRGIEISARLQVVLLVLELVVLLVFSVVSLFKVYGGSAGDQAIKPAFAWFDPFSGLSGSALSAGILVAIFAYWGWDTAVSTNEETRDSAVTPGRSAVISTLLLLVTYLLVTVATQAAAGVGSHGIGLGNEDNSSEALSPVAGAILGGFWGKALILAVLSSSAASAQTTILPAARSTLAMATNRALPKRFAHMHPRFQTPSFSTWTIGVVAIVFYAALSLIKDGAYLGDLILCLGFLIAWYYGLTGFASVWFFRRELGRSFSDLMLKGILPLLGGVLLLGAFVKSAYDLYTGESSTTIFGIAGAFVLGIGSLVLGVVLMMIYNVVQPSYFKGEVVPGSDVQVPDDALVSLGDAT